MKSKALFVVDIYQVVNKCLLCENDKHILNMLYMPIIGKDAISLYNTLYDELKTSNYISEEMTHTHLINNLGISLNEFVIFRSILEGIGLIKTYMMEGTNNSYVYELYSPLSASEFFNHPIFNMVLFNKLGDAEYTKLKNYFKLPKVNLSGYIEVTKSFDQVFKSVPYIDVINEDDIVEKKKNNLKYDNVIDFDLLSSNIPKSLINSNAFTKSSKDLITNLSFLYNLDTMELSNIIKVSINEKGLIDKELLKKNCRLYYDYNNDGKKPTIIYKDKKVSEEKIKNTNLKKILNVFENTNPYDFLKNKYKGVKPTNKDLDVLELLVVDLQMPGPVVNVLIDFVLKTQNNRFIKAYVEVIAGEWKRAGLSTAKEAMEYAEKSYKKNKKKTATIVNPKTKKETKLPSWFDKKEEKKEMKSEDKQELDEFFKEFV